MNSLKVINQLQKRYPGKAIIPNDKNNPSEVICEIEPTADHPDYSVAIAVIDKSTPHLHKKTTEVYEVIEGELKVTVDNKQHTLNAGDKLIINPGQAHFAEGSETWVKVTSKPGWSGEDQFFY